MRNLGAAMRGLIRSYLVLAFLFAVVGIVQCVRWSKFATFSPGYLLNFLPAVAFWIAYVSSRENYKKIVHAVAIPICLLVVLFWGFIAFAAEIFLNATAVVTDPERYEEILND